MNIDKRGYTVLELLFAIWTLICFAAACFAVYAAIHFIMKFW